MESSNVFPLFCFGHVAWLKSLCQAQNVVFDVYETFAKRSYRNRYTIINSQGRQDLTIPLKKKSSTIKTFEVEIDYHEDWIDNHLKSLEASYSLAPFYIHYIDDLKAEFCKKPKYLVDLNLSLLKFCTAKLNLDLKVSVSNTFPDKELNAYWRFNKTPNRKAEDITTSYYPQQFEDRLGYLQNPSVIDLLFNLGPEARLLLNQ